METTESRLMIMKMELENFKSYAGVINIGPFEKSMTAVIGPNGSGKSNVIDAMIFVFGFAAKNMRQANIADLIHKSEQQSDLQYAKVRSRLPRSSRSRLDMAGSYRSRVLQLPWRVRPRRGRALHNP